MRDTGLMSKLLGDSGSSRNTEDYVELNANEFEMTGTELERQVRIAASATSRTSLTSRTPSTTAMWSLRTSRDTPHPDRTMEHIVDDLRQVAEEVDGDIVQKGDDQIIITPTGVAVSREKLS